MSYRDAMMDNYNYYSDSRVRSSMFNPCWSIVGEGPNEAIIAFDDDFLLEDGLIGDKLEEIVDKWVADEESFTEEYRRLRAAAESRVGEYTVARTQALSDHNTKSIYSLPREVRDELSKIDREQRERQHAASQEHYKLWQKANEAHMKAVCDELGFFEFTHPRTDDTFRFCMKVPTKNEVCDECGGSGSVVNPSIDAGGLTQEDFYDDPDFEESYYSGSFDITCPACRGRRVQARPQFPEWLSKAIQDRDEAVWDGIDENLAELRMGA